MRRKVVHSAGAVFEYAWYPMLALLTTPYFLRSLGEDRYGLWMLLFSMTNLIAVLNVGTGAASIKHISAALGDKNLEEVQRVFSGSLMIAIIGGAIMSGLMLALFSLIGPTLFSKVGTGFLLTAAGLVAAILGFVEQIDNVFASTLKGGERYVVAASLEVASKSLQVGACALGLALGGGIGSLFIVLVFCAFARLGIKAAVTFRTMPIVSLVPSFRAARQVLEFSKWGWLHSIGVFLFNISDRFLVGSLFGAASLAMYSIATQLTMQIHAFTAASISVMFPFISRQLAKNLDFSLGRTLRVVLIANVIAATALAAPMLIFKHQILVVWLGSSEAGKIEGFLPYLTLAYWILAINVTGHFGLLGMGRVRFLACLNLVAGLVAFFLMLLLAYKWELLGVCVARISYGLVICFSFVPMAREIRKASIEKTIGGGLTSPQ